MDDELVVLMVDLMVDMKAVKLVGVMVVKMAVLMDELRVAELADWLVEK